MFKFRLFNRLLASCCLLTFAATLVDTHPLYAAGVGLPLMPKPGELVTVSPAYEPNTLFGLTIDQKDPFKFDFLVAKGNAPLSGTEKKNEYAKLIKYFLASLTVDDNDQWVNLSPYEKNRIIDDDFGKTEMGRDLLAQDYMLKQITSSLMYPESSLGKYFWGKVYAQAAKKGINNIPVNVVNKVWIVPDRAIVYENQGTVYLVKSHLKVMLEEDYVALNKSKERATFPKTSTENQQNLHPEKLTEVPQKKNVTVSQIIRDIILPELEKEVNQGQHFANLRQIVSAMILATWYKRALKQSILAKVYADKAKLKGIEQTACTKEGTCPVNDAIYQQYLAAYKKGVYNYIKQEDDPLTHQPIARRYFAGGFKKAIDLVNISNTKDYQSLAMAAEGIDHAMANGVDRASVQLTTAGMSADPITFSVFKRTHRYSPREWSIPPEAILQITRMVFLEARVDGGDEAKEMIATTAQAIEDVLRARRFPNTGVILRQIHQQLPTAVRSKIDSFLVLFDAYAKGELTIEAPADQTVKAQRPAFTVSSNGEYADLFKLDKVRSLFVGKQNSRSIPRILIAGLDDDSIPKAVTNITVQDNIKGRDIAVLEDVNDDAKTLTIVLRGANAQQFLSQVDEMPLPEVFGKDRTLKNIKPEDVVDVQIVLSDDKAKKLIYATAGIFINQERSQKYNLTIKVPQGLVLAQFFPEELKTVLEGQDNDFQKKIRDRIEQDDWAIYRDYRSINLRKSGTTPRTYDQIDDESLSLMIVHQDVLEEDPLLKARVILKLASNGVFAVTRIVDTENGQARLMDVYVKVQGELKYESTVAAYSLIDNDAVFGIPPEPFESKPRDVVYGEISKVITNKFTYQWRNSGTFNVVFSEWFKKRYGVNFTRGRHAIANVGVSLWGFDAFEMKELIDNPDAQLIATELASETFDRIVTIQDEEILKSIYSAMHMLYTPQNELYFLIKGGRVVEVYQRTQGNILYYSAVAAYPGSEFYANRKIKRGASQLLSTIYERICTVVDMDSLLSSAYTDAIDEEMNLGASFVNGKWKFFKKVQSDENKAILLPSLQKRLKGQGIDFQSLAQGEDIRVENGSLSLVISSNVVFHMNAQERKVFKSMLNRKLKNGGIFIASATDVKSEAQDEEVDVYRKLDGDIKYLGTFIVFRRAGKLGRLHVREVPVSISGLVEYVDLLFRQARSIEAVLMAEEPNDQGRLKRLVAQHPFSILARTMRSAAGAVFGFNNQPMIIPSAVDKAMSSALIGKRLYSSDEDKFWVEKLYPTWAFRADEFGDSLKAIAPLLTKLNQSAGEFEDIQKAVEWLNKSSEPYVQFVAQEKDSLVSSEIESLLPENWEKMSVQNWRVFALTYEGQKLKRIILKKLYPVDCPEHKVTVDAKEMKLARDYVRQRYEPFIRRVAVRNYFIIKYAAERLIGIPFDLSEEEVLQHTYEYGLQGLQQYYVTKKSQHVTSYVSSYILREMTRFILLYWGVPATGQNQERSSKLFQSLLEIVEVSSRVSVDNIRMFHEEVMEQLKGPKYMDRWMMVLRIRRYVQARIKGDRGIAYEDTGPYMAQVKRIVTNALQGLLPREKYVLVHRFGLQGEERTFEELADQLNVSRERVRQIEAKALRRLKHPSRTKKTSDAWEMLQGLSSPEDELSLPSVDNRLSVMLDALDADDQELIVLLHGLSDGIPLSYAEVGKIMNITPEAVRARELIVIDYLIGKKFIPAAYFSLRDMEKDFPDLRRTGALDAIYYVPPHPRIAPLTIEQEDELLDLLSIRGEMSGLQWRVLPLVLRGVRVSDIAARLNQQEERIEGQVATVVRKLRFILNLGILDKFGTQEQVIDEIIRLSSESLLQRLFRRTDMDELLAVSEGDIEGIVEFIMQLYPGLYKEEEIRTLAKSHYTNLPKQGGSSRRSTEKAKPKEVLDTIKDSIIRFKLNDTKRNRLVLRRLMRDRYYQTMSQNPQEGLALLSTELANLSKSKNPRDVFWATLLRETYEYYRQATAFKPRGFEEHTQYGLEPLQPAQAYGIWEALQTLQNPEFESAIHMSEARVGKTIMSILSAYNIKDPQTQEYAVHRVLFTTSNQAKFEAAEEFKRRTNKDLDLQVIVIDSDPKKPRREDQIRAAIAMAQDKTKNIVLVANYESVRDFPELIDQFKPDAHIIDEVENLKAGDDTKRAPIIWGRPVRYRMGISARPVINSQEDIIELLLWARHKSFIGEGKNTADARLYLKTLGMDELFEALDPIKVRWRRKVVMPDVKDPIQETEFIDYSPEHEQIILDMRDDFIAWKKSVRDDKDYVDHIYTRQELERQASLDPGLVLPENFITFTNSSGSTWVFNVTAKSIEIEGEVYVKDIETEHHVEFKNSRNQKFRVPFTKKPSTVVIGGISYQAVHTKRNLMDISTKIKRLDEIIDQEIKGNGKIVIMVESVEEIKRLIERYNAPSRYGTGAAVGIYGEILLQDRLNDIKRFRTEAGPVILIGTTATIGSSINLFQAPDAPFHTKRMVRLSRPWTNVDDADRLVGIGQHEQVQVTTLVSRFSPKANAEYGKIQTIDERIEELVRRKRGIAVRVVDGVPNINEADRERLIILANSLRGRVKEDNAMTNPGGIDLNPKNLSLDIKKGGGGLQMPIKGQDMAQLVNISGLYPEIIAIKEVTDISALEKLKTAIQSLKNQ